MNINAVITTAGGNIFVKADHDIIAGAAGTVSSGGGNITLTADTNNSLQNIPADGRFDGTIQFAAGANITAGTGNVTFSLPDCDGSILSNIVSATNITKDDSGQLQFGGAAATFNYSGQTIINDGILSVIGTLTDSTPAVGGVSVDPDGTPGAILGGTGTINANVTVASGGIVDPGTFSTVDGSVLNTGILKVNGDVTFESGSTFRVQLNGLVLGTQYDQLAVV